jgi:dinuclear metal center YbgI/SA1388 family protein
MKVSRKKIVSFCEEYLKVSKFEDHCVNGLQVEGADQVGKIITGVSLSRKLIDAALDGNAQMIMVHHGLFESQLKKPPRVAGFVKNRLRLLLENELNLCGFHLPLDAHPEIGNNISLCRLLGVEQDRSPYDIGFIGGLKHEMSFKGFVGLVNRKLGVRAYALNSGPKKVKRVGVVSGGASPWFPGAVDAGADTFLCGEIEEPVVRMAEELKANFINAGHYNTEKLGIQNLGKLLAKKFKVEVEFVDIPCEI